MRSLRVRGIARSIEIVTEVASGGLEVGKYADGVRCDVTYPCPLTTSSSASCLQLLQVPFM